jgi:transposase
MARSRNGSNVLRRKATVYKPRGVLHPRVQLVGPEHFGIVCVDCAKARSAWMLCDFYGQVVAGPQTVEHTRVHLQLQLLAWQEAAQRHGLRDLIVAVERTGNYHQVVVRACRAAGLETRIVHPFATKQHRLAADPGTKTDQTDLDAIFRATLAGYGLVEPASDETHERLRLLARHRRDLVAKRSAVCCQILEHLEAVLPGYGQLFAGHFWDSPVAMFLAQRASTPEQLRQWGVPGMRALLRDAHRHCCGETLERIAAWSNAAATPHPLAALHQRIAGTLYEDYQEKTRKIQGLEQELLRGLVATPYVLLLSLAGVNVLTAAELAGEMGPIANYANAQRITGRAGLFPRRYQSDRVDRADGPLVRVGNRALRGVLMWIANNLVCWNSHFRGRSGAWKARGLAPEAIRVKVASRFSRIAYQLVAGRQVFRHPACRSRDYVLEKLLRCAVGHALPSAEILGLMQLAVSHLPPQARIDETAYLKSLLHHNATRRGLRRMAEVIPLVLARLGVGDLQFTTAEGSPN